MLVGYTLKFPPLLTYTGLVVVGTVKLDLIIFVISDSNTLSTSTALTPVVSVVVFTVTLAIPPLKL